MLIVYQVMFAEAVRSTVYVTFNEGEAFRSYNTPVDPTTLKIHPSMPGWILGHDPDQVCTMITHFTCVRIATVHLMYDWELLCHNSEIHTL